MRAPSTKMLTVLRDIHEGRGSHYNCHGLSEHGGRASVLHWLGRRGLIAWDFKLTAAGKRLLKQQEVARGTNTE